MDHNLPQVEAAPVQIQQVLLNLIMNALDAVEALPPAERRIIVSTRSLKGESAEVSVRDFGTGLPKDRPEKVFDHFFSTKQTGMGMGLTIVRSIIETHGGNDQRGKRSRPRRAFLLPPARGAPRFEKPGRMNALPPTPREVCLVDDDSIRPPIDAVLARLRRNSGRAPLISRKIFWPTPPPTMSPWW